MKHLSVSADILSNQNIFSNSNMSVYKIAISFSLKPDAVSNHNYTLSYN